VADLEILKGAECNLSAPSYLSQMHIRAAIRGGRLHHAPPPLNQLLA